MVFCVNQFQMYIAKPPVRCNATIFIYHTPPVCYQRK